MENLEPEIWKPIKGYEGLYEVSSWGKAKSLDKKMSNGRLLKGKILNSYYDENGYLSVTLNKNNKRKIRYLCRIVGENFLENYCKSENIIHLDKNKKNNFYKNLIISSDSHNDLINKKFGKLTVIKIVNREERKLLKNLITTKINDTSCLCVCDCGKELVMSVFDVKNKRKSCGCSAHDKIGIPRKLHHYPISKVYIRYIHSAKRRKIEFSLTKEQFAYLISKNCCYCNSTPSKISKNQCMPEIDYIYWNGIDRLDSSKGYILNNCVPCCMNCNYAKGEMTKEHFLNHIKKIYEHSISKT